MDAFRIMNRQGKIIVIEGLWQVGKSTLARSLAEQLAGIFLHEPDHQALSIQPVDREYWYAEQFIKLEEQSLRFRNNGQTVIMERSSLSLKSYAYALGDQTKLSKIQKIFRDSIFSPDILLLMYPTSKHLMRLQDSNDDSLARIHGLGTIPGMAERYNQYLFKNSHSLNAHKQMVIHQSDWFLKKQDTEHSIIEYIKSDAQGDLRTVYDSIVMS